MCKCRINIIMVLLSVFLEEGSNRSQKSWCGRQVKKEQNASVRMRGRHLQGWSARGNPYEPGEKRVPWPRPPRASFHQAKASEWTTSNLPLSWSLKQNARDTQMTTRVSFLASTLAFACTPLTNSEERLLADCLQSQRERGESRFIARWLVQSYKLR